MTKIFKFIVLSAAVLSFYGCDKNNTAAEPAKDVQVDQTADATSGSSDATPTGAPADVSSVTGDSAGN